MLISPVLFPSPRKVQRHDALGHMHRKVTQHLMYLQCFVHVALWYIHRSLRLRTRQAMAAGKSVRSLVVQKTVRRIRSFLYDPSSSFVLPLSISLCICLHCPKYFTTHVRCPFMMSADPVVQVTGTTQVKMYLIDRCDADGSRPLSTSGGTSQQAASVSFVLISPSLRD